MHYETIKELKSEEFKRFTGVQPETFQTMLEVLTENFRIFGRTRKLSFADHLLVTLLYWREYRTQFHLGVDFGVSESTVCRIIQKVERVLIRSKKFHLPGRKVLRKALREAHEAQQASESDTAFEVREVILVDATECPVERPKKNSGGTTRARRSAPPKRSR